MATPPKQQQQQTQQQQYWQQPVYSAAYRLGRELIGCFRRLPRDLRYILGERMLNAATDVIIEIALAYRTPRSTAKTRHIVRAHEQSEEIRITVRLLKDTGTISEKYYLNLLPLIADIAKQLAAWRHSEETKESERDKK